MAKTDTITLRVNPDLKREAEALCEEMGLTLSTAFNIFLKAIVHTRSIPFRVRAYKFPFELKNNQSYFSELNQNLDTDTPKGHYND